MHKVLRENQMHEGENIMCQGINRGLRRVQKAKSEGGKPKGRTEKTLQIVMWVNTECMRFKIKM